MKFQVFSRIKNEKPEVFKKVIPIVGDLTKPNLGISKADETVLVEKVTYVKM